MIPRIFIGFDPRQPLAYNVAAHSVATNASGPVAITPLILEQLPIKRRGLTDFTFSRFLVPWLCDYKGLALFMDPDVVVTGDVYELFKYIPDCAVSVMQDQPSFEWASVMLFDCARCNILTVDYVENTRDNLLGLAWADNIGLLAPEWNHCVGYNDLPIDSRLPKLIHYTQGIPCWYETRGLPEDKPWLAAHKEMNHTVSWHELMGKSIHAKAVLQRMFKRLTS